MSLPCLTDACDGEIVACPVCCREHRVWGDDTYNEETDEAFDWWALTDPDGEADVTRTGGTHG